MLSAVSTTTQTASPGHSGSMENTSRSLTNELVHKAHKPACLGESIGPFHLLGEEQPEQHAADHHRDGTLTYGDAKLEGLGCTADDSCAANSRGRQQAGDGEDACSPAADEIVLDALLEEVGV